MDINAVVIDFSRRVREIYRERLQQVILYGSMARGDAGSHSDMDLLVVLDGQVQPGIEIDRMIEVITDINLETGQLLSLLPVSMADYAGSRSPLLIKSYRNFHFFWRICAVWKAPLRGQVECWNTGILGWGELEKRKKVAGLFILSLSTHHSTIPVFHYSSPHRRCATFCQERRNTGVKEIEMLLEKAQRYLKSADMLEPWGMLLRPLGHVLFRSRTLSSLYHTLLPQVTTSQKIGKASMKT